ncbi:hypothetical protein EYF80_020643 [Liparis tanakae]|uniref:Uncharacterized protein n=1 Tax=Liparis tanakae TaxID=230148 RepID=A0A4Z2HTJ7_9TELE|nr:hypothetical protein EYF80_020643 [Liparis tanakae]
MTLCHAHFLFVPARRSGTASTAKVKGHVSSPRFRLFRSVTQDLRRRKHARSAGGQPVGSRRQFNSRLPSPSTYRHHHHHHYHHNHHHRHHHFPKLRLTACLFAAAAAMIWLQSVVYQASL